jgi:hypothetical protein
MPILFASYRAALVHQHYLYNITFRPVCGSLSSHGWQMFKTPEATVDVVFAFFDGFSAYPLDLRLDLYQAVPKTWFTKTTDAKDRHQVFD